MKTLRVKGISLYYRVESYIKEKIISNEWPEGYKLLSEPELAKELNVSRSTIRQAISNLSEAGLLVRKQGLGTFVAGNVYESDFIFNYLPDEFGKAHTMIFQKVVPATRSVAKRLQIPDGTPVYEICRIRHLKDKDVPAMIETSYLEESRFPNLLDRDLSGNVKLYEVLKDIYHVQLMNNIVTIEPTILKLCEAKYLNCPKGQAALLMTRLCADISEKQVIFTKILIHPDKCRISIDAKSMR